MTYGKLKLATKVLLTGDNVLTEGPEEVLAALEMAFIEVAENVTPLRLLSLNSNNQIIRKGPGNYYVRTPELPELDTDELDIDNELVPVLARILASYVSDKKGGVHRAAATTLMLSYENKVRAYLDELAMNEEDPNYAE